MRSKKALDAPSKGAARTALRHELERERRKKPGRDIEEAIRLADALEPSDPDFGMKKVSAEISGDI